MPSIEGTMYGCTEANGTSQRSRYRNFCMFLHASTSHRAIKESSCAFPFLPVERLSLFHPMKHAFREDPYPGLLFHPRRIYSTSPLANKTFFWLRWARIEDFCPKHRRRTRRKMSPAIFESDICCSIFLLFVRGNRESWKLTSKRYTRIVRNSSFLFEKQDFPYCV